MKVFIHGDADRGPPAQHIKYVAPAAHMAGEEVPAHWVDSDNKPVTFDIVFEHGMAEVEDSIGKYLVQTGQAHRNRLIRPGFFG